MADKLKYNATKIINGYKIDVKVRLDDDCRNGHADFGITATIYEKDKYGVWNGAWQGVAMNKLQWPFPNCVRSSPYTCATPKEHRCMRKATDSTTCEIAPRRLQ